MNDQYKKIQRKPFDPDNLPESFADDLASWSDSAFQARGMGEVADVWREMVACGNTLNFLGFAGSMSSAGYWPAVRWLIKNRFVDVLVSTGANITEDLYEAIGEKYWKVDPWFVDDTELFKQKLDRFYDHVAEDDAYVVMWSYVGQFLQELNSKLPSPTVFPTWKLLYEFGLWLKSKNIDCIVSRAAENKVPVFSPALVDSGFGQAYSWAFHNIPQKDRKVIVEQFWDMDYLLKLGDWVKQQGRNKAVGYIGGGVPKDTIQLISATQFVLGLDDIDIEKTCKASTDNSFKYAFQITTDSPQWGGLSGCGVMTEPISWGKESKGGRNAQVFVDATIAFRIILRAFKEKNLKRNDPPDLSWFFEQSL